MKHGSKYGRLIFVDVERADAAFGRLGEFGAVHYVTRATFHGADDTDETFALFSAWVKRFVSGRAVFVSDNPAYDWQCINARFAQAGIDNPFGHSARRIGDFYAGLTGDWFNTQEWKSLRITPHDHNPVNDAMGNVEAFERMLRGERGRGKR